VSSTSVMPSSALETVPLRGLLLQVPDVWDREWVTGLLESLVGTALGILLILLVASVVWLVVKRLIRRAVERSRTPGNARRDQLRRRVGLAEGDHVTTERRAQRADAVGALVTSVLGVAIWGMAGIMALGEMGLEIGPLIAGAGIVGVAIGFGAQDLVKDFFSGVFMLIEDQYGVGDVIDAGEAVGVVEGISLRTTRIRDVTGTLWHVPNGEIARIGNMSQEWARALLDVDVSYGTDIDAASDIIQGVATEMAREPDHADAFLGDPEMWGVQDLGTDSVVLRLVIKTRPGEQWAITRELRRRIKVAFDVADVEIPFPQRTLWLRTDQAFSLRDGGVDAWQDAVPSAETRRRAIAAAAAGGRPVTATEDETIPEAAEAGEYGGGTAEVEGGESRG
jgi:moderate conductance mechanosensitive channel